MNPVKSNICKQCGDPGYIKYHKATDKYYQAKECYRCQSLRRLYGITKGSYQELLDKQNGTCVFCDKTDSGLPSGAPLIVDHCHKTGKVRGLLCQDHNLALAKFGDNLEGFQKVITYLSDK